MSDQQPTRVLLIDDDETAFHVTRVIMDQIPGTPFVLDFASSAAAGKAAMARAEHDVYLVDYRLGRESGIDLVRGARKSRNRAPMILLTGKGRYEVDLEAMEAGVSDYLDKAKVDPDLMERSIRYALDRARAEAALRDSEARHQSMFDHLPIGLYRIGVDGEVLDANPALVSMLGHPDRDTLQSRFARSFFVNPAHREDFLDRLEKWGVLQGFESYLERPDGVVVHTRNAARSHRNDEGATVYIEGAVEDVSEEWAARDLHGHAARFALLFEGSGLAILLLDLDGDILDANPGFLGLFGYAAEDARGRPLAELAEAGNREVLAEDVRRAARGGATGTAHRRFVAADGTVLAARSHIGRVRSTRGDSDHLMMVLEGVAKA